MAKRIIHMPRAAEVIKAFDNMADEVVKGAASQGQKITKEMAMTGAKRGVKTKLITQDMVQQELKRASQSVGEVVKNDAKYAGRTFSVKKADMNKIKTNKGEGFFKTIMKNASDVVSKSGVGKALDDVTGLGSFAHGFTKEGGKEFQGNAISRAAQNAGYVKKNAAGEIENIDYGKIARGYIGASAGARVVTGGGLYKDGQGNTNIIGVPFI